MLSESFQERKNARPWRGGLAIGGGSYEARIRSSKIERLGLKATICGYSLQYLSKA